MLQLNISKIKIYKEGNPPIQISLQELDASCEVASDSREQCRTVCPVTTTLPPTTVEVTSSTNKNTSDDVSVLNIVLAIVCGVLLLFLIFLASMMCRQQKMTKKLHDSELKGIFDITKET